MATKRTTPTDDEEIVWGTDNPVMATIALAGQLIDEFKKPLSTYLNLTLKAREKFITPPLDMVSRKFLIDAAELDLAAVDEEDEAKAEKMRKKANILRSHSDKLAASANMTSTAAAIVGIATDKLFENFANKAFQESMDSWTDRVCRKYGIDLRKVAANIPGNPLGVSIDGHDSEEPIPIKKVDTMM